MTDASLPDRVEAAAREVVECLKICHDHIGSSWLFDYNIPALFEAIVAYMSLDEMDGAMKRRVSVLAAADACEAERNPLFQTGDFTLHSGDVSRWKIECDAITDAEWEALALIASERLEPFGSVEGIPRGGVKFAAALKKYETAGSLTLLIVDDVFTTGASFKEAWKRNKDDAYDIRGVVAFARNPCPSWITPLFQLGEANETPTRPTTK